MQVKRKRPKYHRLPKDPLLRIDLTLQGFILKCLENERRPVSTNELVEAVRKVLHNLRKINGDHYRGEIYSLVSCALEKLVAVRKAASGWEIKSAESSEAFRRRMADNFHKRREQKRLRTRFKASSDNFPEGYIIQFAEILVAQAKNSPDYLRALTSICRDLGADSVDQLREKLTSERFEGLVHSFAHFRDLFIQKFDEDKLDIPQTLNTIHDKVARLEEKANCLDFEALEPEEFDYDSDFEVSDLSYISII